MFLKSTRLKKFVAAISVVGLMTFGATAVQADVTYEHNLDLTAISGAAISGNTANETDVCVILGGLGAAQSVDFTNLSLSAYVDTELVNEQAMSNQNLLSGDDGSAYLCFSNVSGGAAEGFSDFTAYTKLSVTGTAALANVNFSQTLDLTAVSGASYESFSGGSEYLCLNFVGLGAGKRVNFKNLVAKGFTDQTETVSVDVDDITVDADGEGKAIFCLSSLAQQNAADFDSFASYTSVTLAGTAVEAIVPVVNINYSYGDGISATPTDTGTYSSEYICAYIDGLAARAELASSNASLTVNKGLEGEQLIALNDQSNFAANPEGFASVCWYSYDGSELFPLGDLSAYLSFELNFDLQVEAPLTLGNVVLNGTIDSTLFPELEIVEEQPYIDPHVICFTFSGGPSNEDLRLGNIEVTFSPAPESGQPNLESTTMVSTNDQGGFDYCLDSVVADPDGLGNLTTYDSIEFSASLTVASEWSDVLSRYLATKGLTLKDQSFTYDSETNRTNVWITVMNEGETRLAYNVLGFQWEDRDLIGYEKFWLVDAGEERYLGLGYVTGDATQGDASVDIWTFLKPATPSGFNTSRLKLPAGLVVAGNAFDWNYFSTESSAYFANKTSLSLVLENVTELPITIKAPLTWKVGSSTIKSTGFEVGTVQPGQRIYLQGNVGNDLRVNGDIRQGSSITVSGTISKVTANVVDTSAFNLPEGVEVTDWNFSYAPGDKRTEVYATMYNECAPEDQDTLNDLVADAVYVNNSTKANGLRPIATGWCGESGQQRQILVAYLSGDQRFGKSIKIAADWNYSVTNPWPNTEAVTVNSYNNGASCFVTGGSEWIFEASSTGGKTTVTVVCYNWGNSTAKVNLSGLTGSYKNEQELPVPMAVLGSINKIKLGVGQFKTFKVLSTPGAIRTGGIETTFGGTITITKW